PKVFDGDILTLSIAGVLETLAESAQTFRIPVRRRRVEKPDHRHRRLLRPCRERPRHRCPAECGQQFPPSDGDCHTPLPCEVRKRTDPTPRACSLAVQRAGCWLLRPLSSASTALPPPTALCERRHRGLARRGVAEAVLPQQPLEKRA